MFINDEVNSGDVLCLINIDGVVEFMVSFDDGDIMFEFVVVDGVS